MGKCTPWYVYVLNPWMGSERPCMRKLAALTQSCYCPEYRQTTSVRKHDFTSKGTDHIPIISHPQHAQHAADEPMASCALASVGPGWVGRVPKAGDGILFCKSRDRCVCVPWSRPRPVGIEDIEMMWDDVARS